MYPHAQTVQSAPFPLSPFRIAFHVYHRPHTSDGTSSPVTSATADSARPPHTRTSIPGNGAGAPCGSQTVTDGRILVTSCTPSTALTNGHSTGTPKPDAPYASTSSSGGTRPAANGTTISAAGGAPTRGPYVVGPRKAFAETPQSKVVSRQSVGANGTVYPARGDKVIWKATGYSAAIENGSPGACAAEVARQLDAADGVMDGLCFGRPIVMSTNRTVPSPVPATATAAPATTAQPAVDHRTVAQHLKVLQGLQAQLEGQLELLRPSLLTVPKRPRTASTSSSADDPVTSHLKVACFVGSGCLRMGEFSNSTASRSDLCCCCCCVTVVHS